MLSPRMEAELNNQVNEEMFSSYLYLAMAADFHSKSLEGFAHWMRAQAQEELFHAMKLFEYINERGGRVRLQAVKETPVEWDTPEAAFEAAYKHEQHITGRINFLVDLAIEEKDHASNNFLQWFVAEQVEEEASVDEIVQKLKLMGGARGGLFMLDRELGQRPKLFTLPISGEGGG